MQTIAPLRLTPLAAALALSACASVTGGPSTISTLPPGPNALQRWDAAVQVAAQPDEIRLAPHPTGLSGNQARALTEFQSRWSAAEGGMITVATPAGGANPGAYRVGTDARAFLLSQGLPAEMVQLVGYDAQGQADAPVIVGFQRATVSIPTCGSWGSLTRSASNLPYGNLGCAVTANIAAQVANPADLTGSRPMTPADAGRRTTVIGKYRNGEVTSTTKDEQASGAVSTAVE